MAERAFAPLPITRPAGLARFFEGRYEASQGILSVGNWRRKLPISALRTPKTISDKVLALGYLKQLSVETTSLSVFCPTNLVPLAVGTLTMVLHVPVALLSGDVSRCESIACCSGFAKLFQFSIRPWIGRSYKKGERELTPRRQNPLERRP